MFNINKILCKRLQNFVIKFKLFERIYCSKKDEHVNSFIGIKDKYNGITVSFNSDIIKEIEFTEKLVNSLNKWKRDNVSNVWFNISLELSYLIPILTENNFVFHHVNQNGRVLTMYSWLREDVSSNVPKYAHTMVGVGAIVFNVNEEILVVSERHNPNFWKLPGGYVELNEDIDVAAKREVFEETGIETKFESLICFRHTHDVAFHCSDLYFVVKLSPVSFTILNDDHEIYDCKWMNVNRFLSDFNVLPMGKYFLRILLDYNTTHSLHLSKQTHYHNTYKKTYDLYVIK